MTIDFRPADFIEEQFPEIFNWLANHMWSLITPTCYRHASDSFEVEFFERVIPGKIKESDQPSLDLPPERYPDTYEYHAHIRTFNEVTGNQQLTFSPYNISEFFFKFMTMRNNFDFTFKMSKEMGKHTKGIVSVQMVDDTMVVNHLISHIYD